MALPVNVQLRYWGVAAVVLVALLWLLGDVLVPFVIGGAIAYFLDPVADKLERWGLSRGASVAVITVGAIAIFAIISLAVLPTLIRQAVDLANLVPQLFRDLQGFLQEKFPSILNEESQLRQTLNQIGEAAKSRALELVNTAVSSAMTVINLVVLAVITPVVAVYLLLDWDNMVARIDELLPRDHVGTIRKLASDIDRTMAGFVRGMVMVCSILGSYYAIALMIVGLDFGLVVGFIAGALTFIPYLGALLGGALAVGLALFQFWGEWWMIAIVAAIFQLGQFVEGNFLTPNLVGSSVGLHPVWLLLALSVFGTLFGFIGLLVAVPLAAAIGVLVRFGIDQYKHSKLYTGLPAPRDD
ncbi:AI-2E family transporter [Marinibacterium profundimaris]|uniref:Membrane protein n=1 Tax=Marinibacterium profundimaris TaxID=1679460 RepID=A0A225NH46_9RHOB|nr:AI-2E family transporter [Marinibacterium profundimaris]OWU73007.1 membrane protein [Marinibacterium profundimaris]